MRPIKSIFRAVPMRGMMFPGTVWTGSVRPAAANSHARLGRKRRNGAQLAFSPYLGLRPGFRLEDRDILDLPPLDVGCRSPSSTVRVPGAGGSHRSRLRFLGSTGTKPHSDSLPKGQLVFVPFRWGCVELERTCARRPLFRRQRDNRSRSFGLSWDFFSSIPT